MKHGDSEEVAAVVDAVIGSLIDSVNAFDLCVHCVTMTLILNLTRAATAAGEMQVSDLDIIKAALLEVENQGETLH